MSRLSELIGSKHQQQQYGSGGSMGSGTQSGSELGTLRNAVAYPSPIEGFYNGQPVTVLATGDIVGMSPACQIVDENGRLDWVSIDGVVITDRHARPESDNTRNRLRSQSGTPAFSGQFSGQGG